MRRRRKRKMKTWKKVVLVILALTFILAGSLFVFFLVLQSKGEKNLKTIPADNKNVEAAEEGTYIRYNGKKYRYKEDIINILCIGVDKDIPMEEKRETGSLGLADAILLVSLDTKEHTMKIIAVPRDSIVPVKVMDTAGKYVRTDNKQLAYQYAYGTTAEQSSSLTLEAVSKLFYKIPIQRYCSINFQALPQMNDAIGGVDVTVLEDMTWYDPRFVYGSTLHLEGNLALDYVRQRDENVAGSNLTRIDRQKQYIIEFMNTAKNVMPGNLTLPVTLYNQLQQDMCTDIKAEDITYLVTEILKVQMNEGDMFMIPGDVVMGEQYEEYHVQEENLKNLVISTFYEEETGSEGDSK